MNIRNTYNVVSWAVFSLLVFMGLLLTLPLLPYIGNYDIKVVETGSMKPAIRAGSLLFIRDHESYSIGDIITFQKEVATGRLYITHRVVGVEETGFGESVYITQGDANEFRDAEPVHENSVVGKVVWHLPYVGYFFSFARTPFGVALFMALAVSVFAFDWARGLLRRQYRRKIRRMRKTRRGRPTPSGLRVRRESQRPVVGKEIWQRNG
jgi:signal peptidase I